MLIEYTRAHKDVPVDFTIQRDDFTFVVTLTPVDLRGDGNSDARIGITIASAPLDETIGAVVAERNQETEVETANGPIDAIQTGTKSFARAMRAVVAVPALIMRGEITWQQARPASPVGISRYGGEFIRESQEQDAAYPILSFAALISIALAITNLLPIPGLDGGRILFVVVELLRGKPMAPEREGFVHMLGILLLLSLMVVVVIFDIIDPVSLSSF
jgi:regulator of sigma E protease